MSKVKLLLNIVQDLKNLAESITDFVEAFSEEKVNCLDFNSDPLQITDGEPEPQEEPSVTFVEVREFCGKLVNDGYSKQIKDLLEKYNCAKLSELDSKFYERFLREAEVIPYNGT